MPALTSAGPLQAAFNERADGLSASVGRSCDLLTELHASRTSRDVQGVHDLGPKVTQLRSELERLSADLGPTLERLQAAQPQHALPPRFVAPVVSDATKQQTQAAIKLQKKYQKHRKFRICF